MRYLGIDYGMKRIGVALSDESGVMAFPHSVIENDAVYLKHLKDIASREAVSVVVIGESKDYGGRENPLMKHIDALKKYLQKEYTVVLEPEYASSLEAERFQGRGDMTDASAAAIILQRFLDKNQKSQGLGQGA